MQVPSTGNGAIVAINMIHLGRLQIVMHNVEGIPSQCVVEHGQTLFMKLQVLSLNDHFHEK